MVAELRAADERAAEDLVTVLAVESVSGAAAAHFRLNELSPMNATLTQQLPDTTYWLDAAITTDRPALLAHVDELRTV